MQPEPYTQPLTLEPWSWQLLRSCAPSSDPQPRLCCEATKRLPGRHLEPALQARSVNVVVHVVVHAQRVRAIRPAHSTRSLISLAPVATHSDSDADTLQDFELAGCLITI